MSESRWCPVERHNNVTCLPVRSFHTDAFLTPALAPFREADAVALPANLSHPQFFPFALDRQALRGIWMPFETRFDHATAFIRFRITLMESRSAFVRSFQAAL